MKTLIGIILLHTLVILRAKKQDNQSVPYGTVLVITSILVVYVVYMMYTMDYPEH